LEKEMPMQPTRWEILQLLKRQGRATVDELAKALNMTLMGVRLHLVVLDRDGYVQRSTVRKKPGRPALVYSLTPKAEDIFPKRYDLLAEKLLESLAQQSTPSAVHRILEEAARGLAAPLVANVGDGSLEEKVGQVGRLLDEIGAFASWERSDGGYLIHQHNCLFYRIALRNRKVCQIDTALLREMLGVDIQRRDCLLDGAGKCSFFVPDSES
jgi:predicted ArsR family transcriptional regulator